MTASVRADQIVASLMFAGFIWSIAAYGTGNAGEFDAIQGNIEYADKDTIIVKNKSHDIKGVPVLDIKGERIIDIESACHGKAAIIRHNAGKVVSVQIISSLQA